MLIIGGGIKTGVSRRYRKLIRLRRMEGNGHYHYSSETVPCVRTHPQLRASGIPTAFQTRLLCTANKASFECKQGLFSLQRRLVCKSGNACADGRRCRHDAAEGAISIRFISIFRKKCVSLHTLNAPYRTAAAHSLHCNADSDGTDRSSQGLVVQWIEQRSPKA